MSTALLKFQQREGASSDLSSAIITAALDVCPVATAITENGELIYRNRNFVQFCVLEDQLSHPNSEVDAQWKQTSFVADGRNFSLLTLRSETPISDSQHLALIGRLVGGVAHDFNNLLTGILLYCDLMQGKVAASNPLASKINEIRIAAEQGAGLIRQLMSVGREEKDAPHSVAFNDVLREFLPLLRHLAGENVHLEMELGEGPGEVGISLAQAQQIVLNLVLNARDAMSGGGVVELKTSSREFAGTGPSDRIFELTVKDSGIGMDPQTAARIFEPFFTTKAPGLGTGMGLTTVRKIVEDAGGIIDVDTARGKGTQITVRLPEIQVDSPALEPGNKLDLNRPKDNRGASL